MLDFFNLFVVLIANTTDSSGKRIIKTFRSGFEYELNQSAITESDYRGKNNGTEYPSLLFNLDVTARQAKDTRKITERVQMVLSDLMTADNNGNIRTRTILEVRADLLAVWERLVLEYRTMVSMAQKNNFTNDFPEIASDFQYTFDYNQNQDRLLNIYIEFDVFYQVPCEIEPNFDYNAAASNTTFPFPTLGRFDYSNPFYPNDRNPPV